MFDEYGLWGRNKSKSIVQKYQLLSTVCSSEFQGILLESLTSPDIISRLGKIIESIEQKKGYYQILISILMLNVLNKPPSIDRLIDYWGNQVLDTKFKQDPLIRQIIDFNKNEVTLRSSITAKHILRNNVDLKTAVDVLIKLVRTSSNRKVANYHFEVKNLLLKFNSLQELMPNNGNKKEEIIRYYETIKNLDTANSYPLFWLQYAIACEVLEDFERTAKYFDVAYSLADARHKFDTHQIDNRFAEFLLNRATKKKKEINEAMNDFREAHKLLYNQARKERLYFPYKVASMYESFYEAYSLDMQQKHKDIIKQAASEMISKIHTMPRDAQTFHIRKCESALTTLLEKVSGVSY